MIEDEELRNLYQATCSSRLQALKSGLLGSQAVPDVALLETLRCEAHSLKGDSSIMGLEDITTLTKQVEVTLKALQQQSVDWQAPLVDSLEQALSAIELLVHTATTGAPVEVDVQQVGDRLRAVLVPSPTGHPEIVRLDTASPAHSDIEKEVASPLAASIVTTNIRVLYSATSEEWLQAITHALERLSTHPHDKTALATLREAAQGLKENSLEVGQSVVALVAQQFEAIANSLTSSTNGLTPSLQGCLWQGLQIIEQLVQGAVTDTHIHLDPQLVTAELLPDTELREVYKMTSEERFQRLESDLLRLAQEPDNPEILSAIRREIHSIKGDAQAIQAAPTESLAQIFEAILDSIQRQEIGLTPSLLGGLRESLMAMSALAQTAATGVPHNVEVAQLSEQLLTLAEQASVTTAQYPSELSPATANINPQLFDVPLKRQAEIHHQGVHDDAMSMAASSAEDAELREVYRVVSAERLQRLELGLIQLESQPGHLEVLAELLREAHSLKGDAGSVGFDQVEHLAHAIEDILVGIQHRTTSLNTELGDLLYRGLDAIAQLIDKAATGLPSPLGSTEHLLRQLRDQATPAIDPSVLPDTSSVTAASPSDLKAINEPYRLQTIRVQTRDLDALASQAEQLTLTRIQVAQTTAHTMKLAALWGKWRAHNDLHQPPSSWDIPGLRQPAINPYEGPLEALINKLCLTTQENSFQLDLISQDIGKQVQTLRLLPIENILRIFPRVVRDLAHPQSKVVELIIEGGETTADKRILEEIQDSLMHLVRNAVDHGIETADERVIAGKSPIAKLWIRSRQTPNSIVIEVADDGQGLDLDKIKQTAIKRKLYTFDELSGLSPHQIQDLVFAPGFSTRHFTTKISGRGLGLDVVRNQVERLKGNIQIESTPGQGCTFRLQIRTQLTTVNVVLVRVRGVTHALPIEFLRTTMQISLDDIVTIEGRDTICWNERTLPIRELFDLLELAHSPVCAPPAEPVIGHQRACILLSAGDEMGAFLVDQLLDIQEVVFKPQSALLRRVRNVTGATILGNGEVCTILNPLDLIKSMRRNHAAVAPIAQSALNRRKPLILLVEDSPPVRIQEKRLFENAGYEVITAENGLEGYNVLRAGQFSAVVSDIEMPHLDGLSLTKKIRQHREYDELPIILVTTLSSEQDRQKGADIGADAYIIKGKFNQEFLLETLHRLIG